MAIKTHHILLVMLALTLFSCSKSPEEKARTLFEESIKPRMGNPDLYEYMQMTDLEQEALRSLNEMGFTL